MKELLSKKTIEQIDGSLEKNDKAPTKDTTPVDKAKPETNIGECLDSVAEDSFFDDFEDEIEMGADINMDGSDLRF